MNTETTSKVIQQMVDHCVSRGAENSHKDPYIRVGASLHISRELVGNVQERIDTAMGSLRLAQATAAKSTEFAVDQMREGFTTALETIQSALGTVIDATKQGQTAVTPNEENQGKK